MRDVVEPFRRAIFGIAVIASIVASAGIAIAQDSGATQAGGAGGEVEAAAEAAVGEVEQAAEAVLGGAENLAHTLAPYVEPVAAGGFGYIFHLFEQQPFLFIFVALALGYPLGRIAVAGVSLGSTAGTLVVGLILSLIAFTVFDIQYKLPGLVSTIFLSMFMYALGLKVARPSSPA